MAKKVRRAKKKKKKTPTTPLAANDIEKAAERVTSAKEKSTESFQQEYAYVVKDLRRVLFLSATMFILLIVLNLVLQV